MLLLQSAKENGTKWAYVKIKVFFRQCSLLSKRNPQISNCLQV
jgi:hypothetical protein